MFTRCANSKEESMPGAQGDKGVTRPEAGGGKRRPWPEQWEWNMTDSLNSTKKF